MVGAGLSSMQLASVIRLQEAHPSASKIVPEGQQIISVIEGPHTLQRRSFNLEIYERRTHLHTHVLQCS